VSRTVEPSALPVGHSWRRCPPGEAGGGKLSLDSRGLRMSANDSFVGKWICIVNDSEVRANAGEKLSDTVTLAAGANEAIQYPLLYPNNAQCQFATE
jgi:hypothetical protein